MPLPTSARINGDRLWSAIGESAEIGKGEQKEQRQQSDGLGNPAQ